MPVNLKNKDLSKFSPRAVRCLKWWLKDMKGDDTYCPFREAPRKIRYNAGYDCKSFCLNIFKTFDVNYECPCDKYSKKYVTSTVRAIIAAREATRNK